MLNVDLKGVNHNIILSKSDGCHSDKIHYTIDICSRNDCIYFGC